MAPGVTCPVCTGSDCPSIHVFSVQQAANHLIPPLRSPARNADLAAELRTLLAGDEFRSIGARSVVSGLFLGGQAAPAMKAATM